MDKGNFNLILATRSLVIDDVNLTVLLWKLRCIFHRNQLGKCQSSVCKVHTKPISIEQRVAQKSFEKENEHIRLRNREEVIPETILQHHQPPENSIAIANISINLHLANGRITLPHVRIFDSQESHSVYSEIFLKQNQQKEERFKRVMEQHLFSLFNIASSMTGKSTQQEHIENE